MSDLFQTQSERKHAGKSNLSSGVAGTSSDHSLSEDLNSKFQKWRSWWSKKTHNGCIASPESSDSDDESLNDDDNSIFMKARCRLMRIVGKLDDVFTGVQDVHSERYGPSDVEDSSRKIKLRMRDRFPELDTQQWELMLLMNSVDVMYRKVQAIRSLCTSYKARMGMQVQRRINEEKRCLIETRIEKMDSNCTKTQVEVKKADRNPFVRGFAFILALLSSTFCFIFGKSIQKTTQNDSPNKTQSTSEDLTSGLVKEAFHSRGYGKGLKDSAITYSWMLWMLLTVTSYPRPGIVQRCVNIETFLHRDLPIIQVKRITSATSDRTKVTSTIRALKARYRQTIEYCGEIGSCAYIDRLLGSINAELFEAQKGLDGINDRPFKHSKPYSDRRALLRQALTRGEVRLELKQIANTSTSRRELITKDGLTKIVLRLEARTEGIHMRYDSWRRAREMPGRRHKTADKPPAKKVARLETEMCFRQNSAGLVVRRICVTKKRSLVERAFGGQTINGLNIVPSMNT